MDSHRRKFSFSIIVVIFVTVDEIDLSEIVAFTNLIINFAVILFVKNITDLSRCEKKDFVYWVSFLVNESLFLNFYRSEKRHKKCDKVRRFVLQKLNLIYDILMHHN